MDIQYRNDSFKIITQQQFEDSFSGYKDIWVNNIMKRRERYLNREIFAIHHYKSQDENENEIIWQYRNISSLKVLSIRERESYANFWIDKVKYFDLENNQFLQLIIRELYNNKNLMIAWECTDPSLQKNNEHYYQLTKSYFNTDNGMEGEYFDSHYRYGIFSDIEHFYNGINTDYQDVERGIDGLHAEQLMMRMNISLKMRIWYLNNNFLP